MEFPGIESPNRKAYVDCMGYVSSSDELVQSQGVITH